MLAVCPSTHTHTYICTQFCGIWMQVNDLYLRFNRDSWLYSGFISTSMTVFFCSYLYHTLTYAHSVWLHSSWAILSKCELCKYKMAWEKFSVAWYLVHCTHLFHCRTNCWTCISYSLLLLSPPPSLPSSSLTLLSTLFVSPSF